MWILARVWSLFVFFTKYVYQIMQITMHAIHLMFRYLREKEDLQRSKLLLNHNSIHWKLTWCLYRIYAYMILNGQTNNAKWKRHCNANWNTKVCRRCVPCGEHQSRVCNRCRKDWEFAFKTGKSMRFTFQLIWQSKEYSYPSTSLLFYGRIWYFD